MHYPKLLSLALLCAALPGLVLANGPEASVSVSAVPASTSVSRAGSPNYAAYAIEVKNITYDDKLRIVKLTGNSSVWVGDVRLPTAVATFDSDDSASVTCVATTPDLTGIECTIARDLFPGESLTFTVVFKTPVADPSIPETGATIKFSTKTVYAEYEHNEPYFDDFETIKRTGTTALAPLSATRVETYIPGAVAATVFTGTGGAPSATAADPWTTRVVIPSGQRTTARIEEATLPESCAPDTPICFSSALTIPGSYVTPVLKIFLRRDVTTIGSTSTMSSLSYYKPKAPNINNAVISYQQSPPSGPFVDVPNCLKDYYTKAIIPPTAANPRCIAKRTAFAKKYPVPLVDQGDWEFEIWAIDNGVYRTR